MYTHNYRADPRQDPLLGPLLAELDAMSAQQQRLAQTLPPPVPTYRRNSVPYEPNLIRPAGLSQSTHGRILCSISNKKSFILSPVISADFNNSPTRLSIDSYSSTILP